MPASAPDDLPPRLDGPVLVAVKAQDMAVAAAHLAGRLDGAGYVVCLRHGLDAGMLAGAAGPGRVVAAYAAFDAAELEPGVVRLGNQATLLVGELDGLSTERMRLLASHIAGAEVTGEILGCLQSGLARDAVLAATAVGDRPIAEVLGDPRYRPLLLELARQVLAGAPVPPAPAGGFDPTDLAGSLDRLEQASRHSAKTHSEIYRDLAVRHRPTEVPAILGERGGSLIRRLVELVRAIEQGRRSCARANLDLLAAYERLERLGRPLNAVCSAIGAPDRARTGPLAGRPVGVKDIIAVAGAPTRCGSPASDPRPAAGDAVLVRRLREAGRRGVRDHPVPGVRGGVRASRGRRHAQPPRPVPHLGRVLRRVGGARRGGRVRPGLGTDTGGSIRIPAAYCGVVGLKPTYGLLPLEGVFPLSPGCDHAGTLTATVAGAADLLAVLAGAASRAGTAARPGWADGVHRRRPWRPAERPVGHAAGARRRPRGAGRAGRGRLAAQGADRAVARRAGQLGGRARRHRGPGGVPGAQGPGHQPLRRGHAGAAGVRRVGQRRPVRRCARPPGRS